MCIFRIKVRIITAAQTTKATATRRATKKMTSEKRNQSKTKSNLREFEKAGLGFAGVFTALITPFKRGQVDFKSLKRIVRQQLDGGVQGFVVNGTTGESPTLEPLEVEKIFKFVRRESDKSIPLLLGTGSNSTKTTIMKTKLAEKMKASGALVVVPYYNKPPQRGLFAHYEAISKSAKIPIILYNVPGRTVISLSVETTTGLSKLKNIVGIKEASGQISYLQHLLPKVPKGFLLSSGDDASCLNFMLAGGEGVISVISHVIPQAMRDLSDRARRTDETVIVDYKKYDELNKLMGVEANPIPVKMALHLMGLIDSPELRLPLVQLSEDNKKPLKAALKKLGII